MVDFWPVSNIVVVVQSALCNTKQSMNWWWVFEGIKGISGKVFINKIHGRKDSGKVWGRVWKIESHVL